MKSRTQKQRLITKVGWLTQKRVLSYETAELHLQFEEVPELLWPDMGIGQVLEHGGDLLDAKRRYAVQRNFPCHQAAFAGA